MHWICQLIFEIFTFVRTGFPVYEHVESTDPHLYSTVRFYTYSYIDLNAFLNRLITRHWLGFVPLLMFSFKNHLFYINCLDISCYWIFYILVFFLAFNSSANLSVVSLGFSKKAVRLSINNNLFFLSNTFIFPCLITLHLKRLIVYVE